MISDYNDGGPFKGDQWDKKVKEVTKKALIQEKSLHEQLREMKRQEAAKNLASGGACQVPAHLRAKPKELYDMAAELRKFIKDQADTVSPYGTNALAKKPSVFGRKNYSFVQQQRSTIDSVAMKSTSQLSSIHSQDEQAFQGRRSTSQLMRQSYQRVGGKRNGQVSRFDLTAQRIQNNIQ